MPHWEYSGIADRQTCRLKYCFKLVGADFSQTLIQDSWRDSSLSRSLYSLHSWKGLRGFYTLQTEAAKVTAPVKCISWIAVGNIAFNSISLSCYHFNKCNSLDVIGLLGSFMVLFYLDVGLGDMA